MEVTALDALISKTQENGTRQTEECKVDDIVQILNVIRCVGDGYDVSESTLNSKVSLLLQATRQGIALKPSALKTHPPYCERLVQVLFKRTQFRTTKKLSRRIFVDFPFKSALPSGGPDVTEESLDVLAYSRMLVCRSSLELTFMKTIISYILSDDCGLFSTVIRLAASWRIGQFPGGVWEEFRSYILYACRTLTHTHNDIHTAWTDFIAAIVTQHCYILLVFLIHGESIIKECNEMSLPAVASIAGDIQMKLQSSNKKSKNGFVGMNKDVLLQTYAPPSAVSGLICGLSNDLLLVSPRVFMAVEEVMDMASEICGLDGSLQMQFVLITCLLIAHSDGTSHMNSIELLRKRPLIETRSGPWQWDTIAREVCETHELTPCGARRASFSSTKESLCIFKSVELRLSNVAHMEATPQWLHVFCAVLGDTVLQIAGGMESPLVAGSQNSVLDRERKLAQLEADTLQSQCYLSSQSLTINALTTSHTHTLSDIRDMKNEVNAVKDQVQNFTNKATSDRSILDRHDNQIMNLMDRVDFASNEISKLNSMISSRKKQEPEVPRSTHSRTHSTRACVSERLRRVDSVNGDSSPSQQGHRISAAQHNNIVEVVNEVVYEHLEHLGLYRQGYLEMFGGYSAETSCSTDTAGVLKSMDQTTPPSAHRLRNTHSHPHAHSHTHALAHTQTHPHSYTRPNSNDLPPQMPRRTSTVSSEQYSTPGQLRALPRRRSVQHNTTFTNSKARMQGFEDVGLNSHSLLDRLRFDVADVKYQMDAFWQRILDVETSNEERADIIQRETARMFNGLQSRLRDNIIPSIVDRLAQVEQETGAHEASLAMYEGELAKVQNALALL